MPNGVRDSEQATLRLRPAQSTREVECVQSQIGSESELNVEDGNCKATQGLVGSPLRHSHQGIEPMSYLALLACLDCRRACGSDMGQQGIILLSVLASCVKKNRLGHMASWKDKPSASVWGVSGLSFVIYSTLDLICNIGDGKATDSGSDRLPEPRLS